MPHTAAPVCIAPAEHADYLRVHGSLVYRVTHECPGPCRGVIVISGPFNAERERAYPLVVSWARALAGRGFDVVRFDYRGIGESTGRFETMTFTAWRDDLDACIAGARTRHPDRPVILHGLRVGALLASECFAGGHADGLLMWSPPENCHEHLRDILRRTIMTDLVVDPEAPRRSRDDYIAQLEAGESMNIDGYVWTRSLWLDAAEHRLHIPAASDPRPWRALHVHAGPASTPAAMPAPNQFKVSGERFWDSTGRIVPDADSLIAASHAWLDEAFPMPEGES